MTVFNIREKKFTSFELDFKVPDLPGFCHTQNELYLVGGCDIAATLLNDFRKINASGKVMALKPLPTGKYGFPMTYWSRPDILFTLGGRAGRD